MKRKEIINQIILKLIKKMYGMETVFSKETLGNTILVRCMFGEFLLDKESFYRDVKMYSKYNFIEV